MLQFSNTTRIPEPFPVLTVGHGLGSFIGHCAHHPAFEATKMFAHKWACPSRDAKEAAEVGRRLRLHPKNVSNDFSALLAQAEPETPVVVITTSTETHASQIWECAQQEVLAVICDKPLVQSLEEYRAIAGTVEESDTEVYVTFNHRYNAGVALLRSTVASAPEKVESIEAGFLQDWLMTDPKIQQSKWRLSHPLCGLLDIGTHVADLMTYVAGSNIGTLSANLRTEGRHGAKCFDCGEWETIHKNGLTGQGRFHQAKAGHADDIYIVVHFKNGEHWMWRMAMSADSVFVSTGDGNFMDVGQWTQHFRGHSSLFTPEINAAYGHNPPGHAQGWNMMWYFLYQAIAGDLLFMAGTPRDHLPPSMKLPVPKMQDAGLQTTLFVEAASKSNELQNRQVLLSAF